MLFRSDEGVTQGFMRVLEEIFEKFREGLEDGTFRSFELYLEDIRREQGQIRQEFASLVNAVILKKGSCDLDILLPAFLMAQRAHFGQQRKQKKSGYSLALENNQRPWHFSDFQKKPFITHPLFVAKLCVNIFYITDEHKLALALLHDVSEDTDVSVAILTKIFGVKTGRWMVRVLHIVNKYMATDFIFDYTSKKPDDFLHSYIMFLVRVLVEGDRFIHILKTADVLANFAELRGLDLKDRIKTLQKVSLYLKLFMETSRLSKRIKRTVLFRLDVKDIFSQAELAQDAFVRRINEDFEGRIFYYQDIFLKRRSSGRKDIVQAMYHFWKAVNGKNIRFYVPLIKRLPMTRAICKVNILNFLPKMAQREIIGALIPHYLVSLMPVVERRGIKGDIEIRWKDDDTEASRNVLLICGRRIFVAHVIKYFWWKTLSARQRAWTRIKALVNPLTRAKVSLEDSFVSAAAEFSEEKAMDSGVTTSSSALVVIISVVALTGFLFVVRAFRDLMGARRVKLEGIPESLWLIRFHNNPRLKHDRPLQHFIAESIFDRDADWQIGQSNQSIFVKAGFGLRKEIVGLVKIDLHPRGYHFRSPWFSEQFVNIPCALISYLEILELHRRKGISREVIKETVRISQEAGLNGVCVVNVPKGKVSHWRHLGFEVVDPGKVIVGMRLSEEKAKELLAASSALNKTAAFASAPIKEDEALKSLSEVIRTQGTGNQGISPFGQGFPRLPLGAQPQPQLISQPDPRVSDDKKLLVLLKEFMRLLPSWETSFSKAMDLQGEEQYLEAIEIYQKQCIPLAEEMQKEIDSFGGFQKLKALMLSVPEGYQKGIGQIMSAFQEVKINSYANLADCQKELKLYGEALRNCLEVEHVSESNFGVPTRIADFYFLTGNKDQAETYYAKALNVLLKNESQIQEQYFDEFMADVLIYYAAEKEDTEDFVKEANQVISKSEAFANAFFHEVLESFAQKFVRHFEEANGEQAKRESLERLAKAQAALEALRLVPSETPVWPGDNKNLAGLYRSLMVVVNARARTASHEVDKRFLEAQIGRAHV